MKKKKKTVRNVLVDERITQQTCLISEHSVHLLMVRHLLYNSET
jgi:hypothetical protein